MSHPAELPSPDDLEWTATPIIGGQVDALGPDATLKVVGAGGAKSERAVSASDHAAAVDLVLAEVRSAGLSIGAAGHRVVHGGLRFRGPARIDAGVLRALDELQDLAPLHNGPSLAGIRAAGTALGETVPMVAVFDTAFHGTLPERAYRYGLPVALADRHGVRRFGFHGISYASVVASYSRIAGVPADAVSLVALHLGSGCSVAAVRDGRSVETSMGFTPLEGLVMGTRSGDVDPAVVAYLAEKEGVEPETVVGWLNHDSGLLGLSGLSHDMRSLLAAEAEHAGARRAIEIFCYRARKALAAHLAAMGGAPAVVFTGAMGANSPAIRARILADMGWCGLHLDAERNDGTVGVPGRISPEGAPVAIYAMPPEEEEVIAMATFAALRGEHARF